MKGKATLIPFTYTTGQGLADTSDFIVALNGGKSAISSVEDATSAAWISDTTNSNYGFPMLDIFPGTNNNSPASPFSNDSHSNPNTSSIPSSVTNSSTGLTADLSGATMPAGVTSVSLPVEPIAPSNILVPQVANAMHLVMADTHLNVIGVAAVYDLKLLNQNSTVITGFKGTVKVRLPIPEGLRGTPRIYRYEESTGLFTDMNAIVENGCISFETDHFSYYIVAGTGNAITLDTTNYTMPKTAIYQIGSKLTGTKAALMKVYSTNTNIATVKKLQNGNYQVTGKSGGTVYMMYDVYDKNNKLLTHASVKIQIIKGIQPSGSSARQLGLF